MKISILLMLVLFILGLYYYAFCANNKMGFDLKIEGFDIQDNISDNCPNLLIKKGTRYFLYNTKKPEIPGVNPIEFSNLSDYTEFLEWQRKTGIRCPVLYLQEEFDATGKKVMKMRPSVLEQQGGLSPMSNPAMESRTTLLVDAGHNDPPYNWGSLPARDEQNQEIGIFTPLDKMNMLIQGNQEPENFSPNAMDNNFNPQYANNLVNAGIYKGNSAQG